MDSDIARLERLSALAANSAVVVEIRNELLRELRRSGVGVGELCSITRLSRPRIYQIIDNEETQR